MSPSNTQAHPILSVRGVSKAFGGVQALHDVSFEILPGEVHALVGENGAGKSTLVKILSGAYEPDSGEIELGERRQASLTPAAARALGLAVIYQEFNLVPWMSVVDNIFLGRELRRGTGLLDRQTMRARIRELFQRMGVVINSDAQVSTLSVAQQQVVEIAKALAYDARILIMDEPSAVLAGKELDRLFDVVRALRDQGVSVIYISHRLVEVFTLASRVTVLKDGAIVGTHRVADIGTGDLVRMMVGRELGRSSRSQAPIGSQPVLSAREVRIHPGRPPISFDLYPGEILGLAGLIGSGRTSLARGLAGVRPLVAGRIERDGRVIHVGKPRDAMSHGIVLVPEDRKQHGVLLPLSVERNVCLPSLKKLSVSGVLQGRRERALTQKAIADLDIRPPLPQREVEFLSGGNQQKVVLAKWLLTQPKVVLLDEPTRGVDVGAKFEIYRIMSDLASQGVGILMISSELPEIIAMSDRILVMRDGGIAGELSHDAASEEAIMHLAVGEDESSIEASPSETQTTPSESEYQAG